MHVALKVMFCKFRKKREGETLANGENTLPVIEVGKLCNSREFLSSQICFKLFAEIKFALFWGNL